MTEPVPYTTEDRDMLRSIRDALLGTFNDRGLLTKVDNVEHQLGEHVSEHDRATAHIAEVAAEVARGVAAEALIVAHDVAAAAVLKEASNTSTRRFIYDLGKYVLGSVLALLSTAALATFWLGLKLSIGQ